MVPLIVKLYRVCHVKCNLTAVTYCGTKMQSEAGPRLQLRMWCVGGRTCIHSWTLLASNSFIAVREAFNNAFADKGLPNKATLDWLVTTFRGTGSVCDREHGVVWWNAQQRRRNASNATACLQKFYDERIFGRGLWPLRSPDLISLRTFFQRGFLKEEFIRITHKAWKNWNTTLNRLFSTLN
jgi:hypothetical protein